MKLTGLLFFVIIVFVICSAGSRRKDAISLQDVDALTFIRGERTAYRRTKAYPQLKCVGGKAKGRFEPEVVQCQNVGFDGVDVQWRCEADMPNEFKFGKMEVVCEGYDGPDDAKVLKGSCGLEYELSFTPLGKETKGKYYEDKTVGDGNGKPPTPIARSEDESADAPSAPPASNEYPSPDDEPPTQGPPGYRPAPRAAGDDSGNQPPSRSGSHWFRNIFIGFLMHRLLFRRPRRNYYWRGLRRHYYDVDEYGAPVYTEADYYVPRPRPIIHTPTRVVHHHHHSAGTSSGSSSGSRSSLRKSTSSGSRKATGFATTRRR